jgi:hypothetical protein
VIVIVVGDDDDNNDNDDDVADFNVASVCLLVIIAVVGCDGGASVPNESQSGDTLSQLL